MKNADLWRHSWIELLQKSGYRTVNIGKMHSYPYQTPLGFDERYVVENKDRYLEERYYFDEWDKGLRARGLVKQQREIYRKLPDYKERLGAFEWELPEDAHPDHEAELDEPVRLREEPFTEVPARAGRVVHGRPPVHAA